MRHSYHRAWDLTDISEQLLKYEGKAHIIAGGTDIMVQIFEKDKKWKALACLIDISALEQELRYIREEEGAVSIGALSTHTDLEESEVIRRCFSFLSKACGTVGSPQIRNRGTIGGSICNASPAADPLTPMIAAGAVIRIQGKAGIREVNLKEFYSCEGAVDLQPGEFVKEFVIEKLPQKTKTEFVKVGRRKALAISRMNVSAALSLDENGLIKDARISPGCIFIQPDRVQRAEQAVIGHKPAQELFEKAGNIVGEVMIERTGVRWSTEYKLPAVTGIVEEALMKAAGLER